MSECLMTDTDTREMHDFLNRVRALWNIDREQVPGLTFAQWERFRDAPLRTLIHADDATAAVIWRAMQARLGSAPFSSSTDAIEQARQDGMQQGAEMAFNLLGSFFGLETWERGDGSETFDGDLGAEISNILTAAGVYDDETGRIARLEDAKSEGA